MKYSPYPYRPPKRPPQQGCCPRPEPCRPQDCCPQDCCPQGCPPPCPEPCCPPRDCRPQDCPPPCPEPCCPPRDCRPQGCRPQDCCPQDCPPPCPEPCCPPRGCRPQDCRPQDCRPQGCRPQGCCPKGQAQVLLPRILCSGREWVRCLCARLQVEGLPNCAKAPYTLLNVTQSCASPWWETAQRNVGRRQICLCISIPVSCEVRDCEGCIHTGSAVVEMEAVMNLNCPREECWRHCLMLIPCVRMVCRPVCSQDLCFDTQLEVIVEMYLVRWEPCPAGPPKPACPDLPLYPQPWPL